MKPPNSHECAYGGYKLSSICLHDVGHSENILSLWVGSEEDDTFYEGSGKRGRVELSIELHDSTIVDIDLEELLRFVKKNCAGIYERVGKE